MAATSGKSWAYRRLALLLAALALAVAVAALGFAASARAATLSWGSRGADVRQVQQRMREWGYYSGSVDGVFGGETYNAVVLFQRRNGLKADGKVGPETAAALGVSLSGGTSGGYNSSDLYLLARLVYAEARGEGYTGQVAVAAVVLNRVDSAHFPNSIAGVIYQQDAFTCVSDGQINLAPDDTALRAAQDAMNGWDPSGGALYYYNPARAISAWIFSRTTVAVIGSHIFAV